MTIDEINSFDMTSMSEEETKFLIDEVAKKVKNLIYIQARGVASEVVNGMKVVKDLDHLDKIELAYTIDMIGGDFMEIIGGFRRGDEGEN